MDNQDDFQKLNEAEEKELRDAQTLYEMEKSNAGWQIVKKWLEDMAFHSWVDPREVEDRKAWEWRELNAFHASNVAKEILENIRKAVDRAEYLQKVKTGEIERKRLTI